MSKNFIVPDFKNKSVELRIQNNEVCIYVTDIGLERLISLCKALLSNPEKGHIHLEDYELLTNDSLKGTIAIFK